MYVDFLRKLLRLFITVLMSFCLQQEKVGHGLQQKAGHGEVPLAERERVSPGKRW